MLGILLVGLSLLESLATSGQPIGLFSKSRDLSMFVLRIVRFFGGCIGGFFDTYIIHPV